MSEEKLLDSKVVKVLKPEQTAIVVMDMMDAYCDPQQLLPRCLEKIFGFNFDDLNKAADRIVSFLKASRNFSLATTVFIRMIERPETMPPNIRLKMSVEGYPPVAEKGGQGWNYYKVKPLPGDYEIVKYNYDAFRETDLDKHLKEKGVKTIIIIGGHASVCVDTTARTAAQMGYHTFIPADLTADPGLPNEFQTPYLIRKRLDTINSVMGYMPLSSTILDIWKKKFNRPKSFYEHRGIKD